MPRYLYFLIEDLAFIALAVTTSLAIGISINIFRDDPLEYVYQSKEQRIMKVATRQNREGTEPSASVDAAFPPTISLEELRDFIRNRRGLVLDARPEIFHRLAHIPGALSLPREDFERSYERLKEILEKDKNQSIVIYCSAVSCQDSELVRKALVGMGYNRVAVMRGGWAAWKGESGETENEGL